MKQINSKQPALKKHRQCLIWGEENPFSFGLHYIREREGFVSTKFTGNESMQGYDGIMHGGILSALLDTAMANCLMQEEIEALTGELKVRFLEPVSCHSTLAITAWIDSSLPPLYYLKSQIRINNKVVCKARAKFMEREYQAR
jgi:uncharacterized protein (TIGR00369 family)